MDPATITAVILTRDEERNLPRAITSLPHGMPVLVVDAESRDDTAAYARAAGARVIERAWTNFVDARHFALANVETEWVLQLDADEALDDVLCDSILHADGTADGYTVSRSTFFRGKPMRMWTGERLLRLVRTSKARIVAKPAAGGSAALHERLECDGVVNGLSGTLLHYSYDDRAAYREKFARYTDIEAQSFHSNPAVFAEAAIRLVPRFLVYLFVRGAILDGAPGWYVAWHSALYPVVVAWKAL